MYVYVRYEYLVPADTRERLQIPPKLESQTISSHHMTGTEPGSSQEQSVLFDRMPWYKNRIPVR